MTALVMELVEGEDLSQRIARGAIPLDEALPMAKQIAEALEPVPRPFVAVRPGFERNYGITRDGKRFLGVVAAGQTASGASAAPQIQVVLNWFEELKARVPTK